LVSATLLFLEADIYKGTGTLDLLLYLGSSHLEVNLKIQQRLFTLRTVLKLLHME
jgi:hypothetical protein